jgi:hypothetical protein
MVVLFCSCQDILEEKVEDRFTPSTVFVNETGAYHFTIGLYSTLIHFDNYKEHGNMLPMIADGLAPTGGRYKEYLRSRMTGNIASLNQSWSIRHVAVNSANMMLHYLPNVEMPEARKTEFEGHAYFIRAQALLELFRWFGKAVVNTEPTLSGADIYSEIATPEETINQAVADFRAAAERLPLRSEQLPGYKGMATKGAAEAYLAKALMERAAKIASSNESEDYAEALQLVNAVIASNEYRLLDDYAKIFDEKNQNPSAAFGSGNAYDEILFSAVFEHWTPGRVTLSAGNDLPVRFMPNQSPYTAPNAGGQQQTTVQRWWYDYYTSGKYTDDYRNTVNYLNSFPNKNNPAVTVFGYPLATPTSWPQYRNVLWVGKYKDPNGLDVRTHTNDFILIRLAELYLMRAELLNELNGPTQEAIDALNVVRERARNSSGTPSGTPEDLMLSDYSSKEDLRRQILDERGQELFAEGHRLYDLLRMKRDDGMTYYQYMMDPVSGWVAQNFPTNKWTLLEFNPRDLLMPIPQIELDRNPLVTVQDQNPGW